MISAPLELTCRNGLLVLIFSPLTSHTVPDCGDIPSNKQARQAVSPDAVKFVDIVKFRAFPGIQTGPK